MRTLSAFVSSGRGAEPVMKDTRSAQSTVRASDLRARVHGRREVPVANWDARLLI